MPFDGIAPRLSSIVQGGKTLIANLAPAHAAAEAASSKQRHRQASLAALVMPRHGRDKLQLRGPNYSGQLSAMFIES